MSGQVGKCRQKQTYRVGTEIVLKKDQAKSILNHRFSSVNLMPVDDAKDAYASSPDKQCLLKWEKAEVQ